MIWRTPLGAFLFLLLLSALGSCDTVTSTDQAGHKGMETVVASTPSGASLVLEVARSDAERARGLMGRLEVPAGTGMFFLFDEVGRHPIWMFNCLTELDLIWLDEERRIVNLVERAPVCRAQPCPNYGSEFPSAYVIEVGPGQARELGLVPGGRVLLSPLSGEQP